MVSLVSCQMQDKLTIEDIAIKKINLKLFMFLLGKHDSVLWQIGICQSSK